MRIFMATRKTKKGGKMCVKDEIPFICDTKV